MSLPEVIEKMITAKLKYDENVQEAKKFENASDAEIQHFPFSINLRIAIKHKN